MSFQYIEVKAHQKQLNDLRWNCDGQYLGSIGSDKSIKVLQLDPSGNCSKSAHSGVFPSNATQFCWHPSDPSKFAVAGQDKVVEIWDVRGSRCIKGSSFGANLFMDWSPDGNYLAVGNENDYLSIIDVRTGARVKHAKIGYEVNQMAWTANSDHLIVAINYRSIGIGGVDVLQFTGDDILLVESIYAHGAGCVVAKADPQYRKLVTGSTDCSLNFWDLEDLICQHSITLSSEVRGMSFRGDGRFLAVSNGKSDRGGPTITLFDAESATELAHVSCSSSSSCIVGLVAWHPKHDVIAVALEDNRDRSGAAHSCRLISLGTTLADL